MDRTFRPFFEKWYPRLVRYLRARMGDEDQAEDIAQEAFVRLLDQAPRDPAAWLFTVAANLAAKVPVGGVEHTSHHGWPPKESCSAGVGCGLLLEVGRDSPYINSGINLEGIWKSGTMRS